MKKKAIVLSSLIVGLVSRLWLGIYQHNEFATTHLFLKHRPTWKWSFHSPVGMSDDTLHDLTKEQREEQLLFNEFVSSKGYSQ